MARSTITSRFQTTIPKEVRQRLGLGPSDELQWEVVGKQARVTPGDPRFLKRQGTIEVGRGSAVDDVHRARALRGK